MTEIKEKKTEDIKKEAEAMKCPLSKSLYYIEEFLSGPMCGKCFPCSMGTYEARLRLKNIVSGSGTDSDLFSLKRIASYMLDASMCKKGKDTAKYMLDWINEGNFTEHLKGRCPSMECKAFIEYRVIPELCIMCGLCQEACRYNAIIGEKRLSYKSGYLPFEIRQRRCTKCGDCIKVCPTIAIEIISVKTEKGFLTKV
ncbi:MAG: 4Fe-4S binding protein [Nitrospirae bacterium]|nr:4Fe-4S binding protein [Nitrospirota bacterium]